MSKMIRSALYVDEGGNELFVPTERMWSMRWALNPTAVLERASLQKTLWTKWVGRVGSAKPTDNVRRFLNGPDDNIQSARRRLIGWLYGDRDPRHLKIVYPSQFQRKNGPREGEFFVSENMLAFRHHARPLVVARSIKDRDPAESVSTAGHSYWLDKHRNLPWFRDWLLQYQDLPEGIYVATASEVMRCRLAWDYHGLLRAVRGSGQHYTNWVRRMFPGGQLAHWLFWLFGGPEPAGWYIVPEGVLKVRQRLCLSAIADAAGDSGHNFTRWDATKKQALQDAIAHARNGSPGSKPNSPAWHEAFPEDVGPRKKAGQAKTKRTMLRYAENALLSKALPACELKDPQSWWVACRERAERCAEGAATELEQYALQGSERGEKAGTIGERLFLPPPGMRQFRQAARRLASEQRIDHVARRIPFGCFLRWLEDWTMPNRPHAYRNSEVLAGADTTAPPARETAPEPHNQTPWFDHAPPEDGPFRYGPVEGSIAELTGWIGQSRSTLKRQNGKPFWIRQLNRYSYEAYFDSHSKYARINQKALAASVRE